MRQRSRAHCCRPLRLRGGCENESTACICKAGRADVVPAPASTEGKRTVSSRRDGGIRHDRTRPVDRVGPLALLLVGRKVADHKAFGGGAGWVIAAPGPFTNKTSIESRKDNCLQLSWN